MLHTRNHGKVSQNAPLDGFRNSLGKFLLAQEQPILRRQVRRFHGESLLWLGPREPGDLGLDLSRCLVRHKFFGGSETGNGSELPSFVGKCDALPLASASVEGVVCHHFLECAQDSRGALRELSRVLEPGGRLLVIAFNPYSFWGWRRRFQPDAFQTTRFVSPFRLRDWLKVLGFEVDQRIDYVAFRPPLASLVRADLRSWKNLADVCRRVGLPFGGVYLLMARKRNFEMILPRRRLALRTKPELNPVALATQLPCRRVA